MMPTDQDRIDRETQGRIYRSYRSDRPSPVGDGLNRIAFVLRPSSTSPPLIESPRGGKPRHVFRYLANKCPMLASHGHRSP